MRKSFMHPKDIEYVMSSPSFLLSILGVIAKGDLTWIDTAGIRRLEGTEKLIERGKEVLSEQVRMDSAVRIMTNPRTFRVFPMVRCTACDTPATTEHVRSWRHVAKVWSIDWKELRKETRKRNILSVLRGNSV